jgi:hypothetical protein
MDLKVLLRRFDYKAAVDRDSFVSEAGAAHD